MPTAWRGLYSPPGIPPGIRLESRNSAGLITEFDIPAESARNIMGIMFLLLCLVIPYRVRPESIKKKMKSVDRPVDFHGTSKVGEKSMVKICTTCLHHSLIVYYRHLIRRYYPHQLPRFYAYHSFLLSLLHRHTWLGTK